MPQFWSYFTYPKDDNLYRGRYVSTTNRLILSGRPVASWVLWRARHLLGVSFFVASLVESPLLLTSKYSKKKHSKVTGFLYARDVQGEIYEQPFLHVGNSSIWIKFHTRFFFWETLTWHMYQHGKWSCRNWYSTYM